MVAAETNVFYNINPINFTITQTLGVNETASNKDVFVVYPNPSKGLLNIKFTNSNEVYDINVYDVSGKLVFTQANNKLNHDKIGTFDLSQLVKGDYLIRVKSKNMEKTIKWIKE